MSRVHVEMAQGSHLHERSACQWLDLDEGTVTLGSRIPVRWANLLLKHRLIPQFLLNVPLLTVAVALLAVLMGMFLVVAVLSMVVIHG